MDQTAYTFEHLGLIDRAKSNAIKGSGATFSDHCSFAHSLIRFHNRRVDLFLCVQLWYFAQPFRDSGALVLMIKNVAKDCAIFLMLAFFALFGFALALHVLFRSVDPAELEAQELENAFKTFSFSLLTMFYAMVGTFEPKVMQSSPKKSAIYDCRFSPMQGACLD